MNEKNQSNSASAQKQTVMQRCNYCGSALQIVWVHGHGQCHSCKVNIDECCRGESCEKTEKSIKK
jgi:hypothetical protein